MDGSGANVNLDADAFVILSPGDATPPPRSDLGEPAMVWHYVNPNGTPYASVSRYQQANGKTFRPCHHNGQGIEWKRPPYPAPLYRVQDIINEPDKPVLVVGGEKATDAAKKRFPGFNVTTSFGGENAEAKTDWSPLRGLDLTSWPDNDATGNRYFLNVQKLCREIGCASVRIIVLPAGAPESWDLADPVPDGWDLDQILADAVLFESDAYTLLPEAEKEAAERDKAIEQAIEELAAEVNGEPADKAAAAFCKGLDIAKEEETAEHCDEPHSDIEGETPRELAVTTFKDLVPEPRTYLWQPYIPDNGYGLIAGRGGSGKTTTAVALVAWGSTGKFPKGCEREPVRGLIIELQDSDAHEIKPKLIANGYNPEMVLRLQNKRAPSILELQAIIVANNIGIVLISPLNRFVGQYVKSLNDDKEVAPLLDAVNRMGEQNKCLIIGVKHLNEKSDLSGGERIGNAGAFADCARTTFLMAYDRETDIRLLESDKASRGDYGKWRVTLTDVGEGASDTYRTACVKVTIGDCEEGDSVETLLRPRQPMSESAEEMIEYFADKAGDHHYKEIAKALHRPPATTKTQLNRLAKRNQILRGQMAGTFAAKPANGKKS